MRQHNTYTWQKRAAMGMLFVLFAMANTASLFSQNTYRFSQYMFNELSVNPAYAGTKNGIMTNLIYRTQWMNVEGQPTTQMVSLHSPVKSKKVGLGALLYKEDIGIQNDIGAYVSYSYHIRFNGSKLALGLQGGFANKTVNWNEIRTSSLVDENIEDPLFPNETESYWSPNFGFGAYFYNEQFYFGLSAPRVFSNELPLSSDRTEMFSLSSSQIHFYITSGYVFHLKNDIVIKPSALLKGLKDAPNQLDANLNFFFPNGLNFGLGVHFKDAYVFMLGYDLGENLRFGYSFDLTTSDFSYNNPSTHEIVLSYLIQAKNEKILSPRYF